MGLGDLNQILCLSLIRGIEDNNDILLMELSFRPLIVLDPDGD